MLERPSDMSAETRSASSGGAADPADERQLVLPFIGRGARPEADGPAVSTSRRALRGTTGRTTAPRRVRWRDERAVEERAMEETLLGLLPPGKALQLTLTDNRYSMVAVRRLPDGYRVRLHRMFAAAEPRLVRALARYVVHNDARASALLGEHIERHKHQIRQQPRQTRTLVLRTAGAHHDLQVIFDALNQAHFGGALDARITWGPAAKARGRRRSIKMGSFSVEDRIIRIHPALDQPDVPGYFVAWIVFHEMLHGKHAVVRVGGRRCFHPPAFLDDERGFPDYERATAWERANIDKLLGP